MGLFSHDADARHRHHHHPNRWFRSKADDSDDEADDFRASSGSGSGSGSGARPGDPAVTTLRFSFPGFRKRPRAAKPAASSSANEDAELAWSCRSSEDSFALASERLTESSESFAGWQREDSEDEDGEWDVVKIRGDGNCLFRALSDQLHQSDAYYNDIRCQIVDYIERESETFQPFVENEHGFEPILEYCNRMRQDGEWGGNPELFAAARLYEVQIVVHQVGAQRCTIGKKTPASYKAGAPQVLHLRFHGDHYDSLHRADPLRRNSSLSTVSSSASFLSSPASGGHVDTPPRRQKKKKQVVILGEELRPESEYAYPPMPDNIGRAKPVLFHHGHHCEANEMPRTSETVDLECVELDVSVCRTSMVERVTFTKGQRSSVRASQ